MAPQPAPARPNSQMRIIACCRRRPALTKTGGESMTADSGCCHATRPGLRALYLTLRCKATSTALSTQNRRPTAPVRAFPAISFKGRLWRRAGPAGVGRHRRARCRFRVDGLERCADPFHLHGERDVADSNDNALGSPWRRRPAKRDLEAQGRSDRAAASAGGVFPGHLADAPLERHAAQPRPDPHLSGATRSGHGGPGNPSARCRRGR